MCTRSTPFGLFAGCSIATLGEETSIIFSEEIKRITRLDTECLCQIHHIINKDINIRKLSRYKRNTSLYSIGSKFRYINNTFDKTNSREYQILAIAKSYELNHVFNLSANEVTFNKLVAEMKQLGMSEIDANELINNLIDVQFLVSTLEPSIVGEDALKAYILQITNTAINQEQVRQLKYIQKELNSIANLNSTLPVKTSYKKIIENLQNFDITYKERSPFQVDLKKTVVKATVNKKTAKDINSLISYLNKTTPVKPNSNLAQFKKKFISKYGTAEVPLLLALDPDIGVGYPSNKEALSTDRIFENLYVPNIEKPLHLNLHKNQLLILDKILDAIKNNKKEIFINDIEFSDIDDELFVPAATMYLLTEFISDSNLINLKGIGNSASSLIARFSHIDNDILRLVNEITEFEQGYEQDAILMEIIHHPGDRSGNILFRPHLRSYEFHYLANSDFDPQYVISPSDIIISIQDDDIILRSKTLRKRVLPCNSNAHNFHLSDIPVYRFLCEIHSSRHKDLLGNYRFITTLLKYYPRIRYKNIILYPESWIIDASEFHKLVLNCNDEELISIIRVWRTNNKMPELVLLCEFDNELFVDFNNLVSINAFISAIKNKAQFTIKEFTFDEADAAVKDINSEVYGSECIWAFHR